MSTTMENYNPTLSELIRDQDSTQYNFFDIQQLQQQFLKLQLKINQLSIKNNLFKSWFTHSPSKKNVPSVAN